MSFKSNHKQSFLPHSKERAEVERLKKVIAVLEEELRNKDWAAHKTNEGIKLLYKELEKKNKELEGLLEKAEELRMENEKMQREFVANVSHEFRTPVAAIKGFTETLMRGGLADYRNRQIFVKTIETHANRLEWLVEELLALSQIESGAVVPKIESIALAPFATQFVKTVFPLAKLRKIQIKVNIPPHIRILADRPRLKQVLQNLFTNAIKYNRTNSWIKLEAYKEGREAVIEVRDNGIGISKEDLPHIFERFYRVKKLVNPELGNTGLGLHIVRQIIESTGGKIWVESKPRKGTSFHFTLPLAQ